MANIQNQKSFQYLTEVETVAQDLLTDKQTKLDLSNARNKFREALRALETVEDRNSWMQLGSVYIQRPTEECKVILKRGDVQVAVSFDIKYKFFLEIASADKDIDVLDRGIKTKVYKLRDLEHEPRLEGFTLEPISAAEAKALNKSFGLI